MKAIAYDKYGSFDVLALRDIGNPAVKDGEVLVRVYTAGVMLRFVRNTFSGSHFALILASC